MAKYIMMGKYSTEAVNSISAQRTQSALECIKSCGGEVQEMLTMLGGCCDLMIMVDMLSNEKAMQCSVKFTGCTGIEFCTCPAMSVEEFDRLCQ